MDTYNSCKITLTVETEKDVLVKTGRFSILTPATHEVYLYKVQPAMNLHSCDHLI